MHRLDPGLYSHPEEFWGEMESEPMLTPLEKIPSTEKKKKKKKFQLESLQ